MRRRRSRAGMTLLEVLVAVTLLTLLILGMSMALRVGLSAFGKVNQRLMDDRRVAGAQRILQSELEGLVPVMPACLGLDPDGGQSPGVHFVFLQAEPQFLRMVSTFSLQQAWRGVPQILEFFVIPGAEGRGVRLVVNETPYSPVAAGGFCHGVMQDPALSISIPRFPPEPQASPSSFVLADKLAFCHISYYVKSKDPNVPDPVWLPRATGLGWPLAIRIDMAPLTPDLASLQPLSVVAKIHLHRAANIPYVD
jgi:prepilin-type N-terminal cleavage/methylation domain-containing protein